ncbi:hypothetical protein [Gilliamella sp. B3023]|uniref:hypothetical protein n=1 Tax=Gilliamella sp. B3023 TaxID=2817987 RepID=UPI00226AF4C1|nr:hypothetical protein [Gilliamella sp. B3023]
MISPTATRNRFTIEDQIKATAHVECRKDANVIDEIPKVVYETKIDNYFFIRKIFCI